MKKMEVITTCVEAKRFYNDLAEELRLNNLYKYGFTQDATLFITELGDNKPSTITEFEGLMEKSDLNYLFFIELDREKAQERYKYFWVDSEKKYFVYKNGSLFEYWINYEKRQHSKIGDFWRKADQEKARICAKNIFVIYQQSQAETIKAKKEARIEAKIGDLVRYKNISFDFVYFSNADYKRVSKINAEQYNKTSKKVICCNYYNGEQLQRNATGDDIVSNYFDKNGYYIKNKLDDLKRRAENLKEQRLKAILEATNCDQQKKQVNELIKALFEDLGRLNDFLTLQLKQATNCDLFYLEHRISPTIRAIKRCNEFMQRINEKDFKSNINMINELNELKESVSNTQFYNKSYLELSDQERASKKWNEKECEKLTAIYYNYSLIQNGVQVLDLEKARAKQ